MEAPLSITPDFQEEIKLIDLKEEKNPDKKYTLTILFSSYSMDVKIIEENDIIKNEYSNEFTLDDLHKNGKFFKICENISNVKSSLEETFQMKKPILKLEEESIKLLIIPLITALGQSILIIPKNKKNDKDNISILSNIIKKQQNEINNLNEKVNKHEERINLLEERIKKLEEKEKDEKLIKSDIIKSKDEIDLLNKWINNKNNTFSLIYKGSRDGDTYDNFHEKCDNKGPTIMIIKTDDGEIFGGYTEKSWNKNNSMIPSPESFLFNLNKKKKYFINGNGYIISEKSYGQTGFGDANYYEFYFYNNYLTADKKSLISGCSSYNFKSLEISGGKKDFHIKEMEVYKIN